MDQSVINVSSGIQLCLDKIIKQSQISAPCLFEDPRDVDVQNLRRRDGSAARPDAICRSGSRRSARADTHEAASAKRNRNAAGRRDGIRHVPGRPLRWFTVPLGGLEEGLQQGPLFVGKVGGVRTGCARHCDLRDLGYLAPLIVASRPLTHPSILVCKTVSSAPFLKGGTHKLVVEPPNGKGEENVPKLLRARAPEDTEEERKIHKLAGSRHAPGDWIFRARVVSLSWQGLRTANIAEQLGCHPKTVRKRLHRFNVHGMDGLGDRPGPAASPASPKRSAPGSSPWSPKTRRASSSPSPAAASKPKTRRGPPTGLWTRSPRPHKRWASR
jgi:hypothetical protein